MLPEVSGGIETYARELIPRIADRLDGWRISAIANEEGAAYYPQWDERIEWHSSGFGWADTGRRLFAETTSVPRRLRKLKPDVVHSMANTACLWPGAPQLTTVYDATQVLRPDPSLTMAAFRQLLRAAPRRSDLVVTISESAKSDIVKAFGTNPDKVRVVLLAARVATQPFDRATLDERFGLGGARYFLTPAARRPNKNIPALLRAYASLPADGRPLLVLPGADGGDDEALNAQIAELGIADSVVFPGWVGDQELDSLYAHAVALIFPSLMEGFGLPVLEAMQVGCAVATANVSSMPEIGGDAALYFDPTDDDAIAGAMLQLASDESLRERLAKDGLQRAAQFSWDRAADETVALYEELIA